MENRYCQTPQQTWYKGTYDGDYGFRTEYAEGVIHQTLVLYRLGSESKIRITYKNGESFQWSCQWISSYNGQFGISVSRDGRFVFVQTWDKGLFCLDARTGEKIWQTKRRYGITHVFVNDTTLLVCQHGRALQLLSIESGEVLQEKRPAKSWGFYFLDSEHIICHTRARVWEIIRASDLETVETVSDQRFPQEPWCVRKVYLTQRKLGYEAFHTIHDTATGHHDTKILEGTIDIQYLTK